MITIVDYKAGNLTSVKRALDHLGIENQISKDPDTIRKAEQVIFPGVGASATEATLQQVVGNDAVQFKLMTDVTESPESAVPSEVMAALRKTIDARYPGLPIQPYMESGGTDGMHYRKRGYATVAISGAASRPEDMYAHGFNERLSVDAFYGGLDHWYRLLKELAR